MTPTYNSMYDIIKTKILNNRPFFTGIAIILVVLYHYYCAVSNVRLLSIFRRGYIGVDIFFFFSGLGLGYSYNKNSLTQFYKNRLWRIMPLYWIWAIVHLVAICIQKDIIPSFLDIFGILWNWQHTEQLVPKRYFIVVCSLSIIIHAHKETQMVISTVYRRTCFYHHIQNPTKLVPQRIYRKTIHLSTRYPCLSNNQRP